MCAHKSVELFKYLQFIWKVTVYVSDKLPLFYTGTNIHLASEPVA